LGDAAAQKKVGQPGDGISRQPVLQLILELDSHIHVPGGSDMASPAISAALDQCGSATRTRQIDRALGSPVHSHYVVSVDTRGRNTVGSARFVNVVLGTTLEQRQVAGIEIVFADEDDGQPVDSRQ